MGALMIASCIQSSGSSSNGSPAESPTNTNDPIKTGSATTSSASVDHQVGNGGGGVCIASNCITLSEAGLKITSPIEEYYQLSTNTVKAIKNLTDRLPLGDFKEYIVNLTIGTGQTFKVLNVADPLKLEVIRQRYAKVLAQYLPETNMADVQIFAFSGYCNFDRPYSSEYCTYLLPEFFKLNSDQQAKILIHETNVRNEIKAEKFISVLELDGLMEDLLADTTLIIDNHFRIDRWVELLQSFGRPTLDGRSRTASLTLWLAWLQKNKGIIFDLSKITKSPDKFSIRLDIPLLTSNFEIPPAFARVLNNIFIISELYEGTSNITKKELEQICNHHLMNKNDISFLYAFRNQTNDYELLKISCSIKNGQLMATHKLFQIN